MIRNSRKSKGTTIAAKPVTTSAAPTPAPAQSAAKSEISKIGHISFQLVKPEAKSVCVAGSFNGWRPEQTPLLPVGHGRWAGELSLKPGCHEYLFVVDGQWLPDPNAKEAVQNPYGGVNSVLKVQ